ncbi:hypothetical protein, partial [Colwellia psychrerythraea]
MKNKIYTILLFITSVSPVMALECENYSVKHLQIQKTTVLVKFNSLEGAETGWKLVGYHAHEGTKEMYS